MEEVPPFTTYPFSETVLADLAAAGYRAPTPIQAASIGPALEGKDLIGLAQTGTGKTAAFALPIIQRAANRMELTALVLAPTRELAQQIVGVFQMLGRSSGVRVACTVGGIKMENDWKALSSWPNVLVATPGRLIDHLESGTVTLKEVETFVVDEADRMHDMGFIPQIRRIVAMLPANRQTLMFTATMPPDVERIVRQSMHDPVRIQVGSRSKPAERAEQQIFTVHEADKVSLLLHLLKSETGRVLVFLRTKRGVDRLARRIGGRRHTVARLHGDREMHERNAAMQGFRDGRYRILVATDIAARGIDVADVEHVINYDFPRAPEDYVHRIGRTARLAASGRATSFVTPADRKYLADLERLIGAKLPVATTPAVPEAKMEESPRHGGRSSGGKDHGADGGRSRRSRRGRSGRRSSQAPRGETPKASAPVAAAPAPAAGAAEGDNPSRKRRRRRGRRGRKGRPDAAASAPQNGGGTPSAHVAPPRPAHDAPAPAAPRGDADAGGESYREAQVVDWD